ncbi:16S rRNA (guanine(966)-N(2))-methyltransferase RsmD [Vibrio sp. UCD-FRSSP16_10]|nr:MULTISPECIES: 16S rRNA (guanine(966)-N(2))-methyltransferase RsmD [unclassified Vibrio]OBT12938.1 16S rRNA (guanine(966)-N(2))-methyltransferase RsmD [Vibrio sp. UCD-FRSSP16_30]OBT19183.1 16S rRNA (guanine(966)-N(2))-methyltransferase RsmD [Vibrio sp. UCD-FRSSP16_10]
MARNSMRKHQHSSSPKNNKSSGSIRIISGLWRGRKLPVHDAEGLRPTTDRVKETLFNWIASDIPNARCLDLFAGSGGLGFESASRQAEEVTLIELNSSAFQQLQKNAQAVKATNINVLNQNSLNFLKQPAKPYDIVFIDPPFRQGLLAESIELLENNGWLNPQALIYIETEKELEMPTLPDTWQLHREKVAGQVRFQLFIRE